MECRSLRRRLSPFARRQVELFFNKVIGENAGTATCSGGGSGPGDLERTLPLVRAGHAVFVQGVVGNLNLPMCFAAECRSIDVPWSISSVSDPQIGHVLNCPVLK